MKRAPRGSLVHQVPSATSVAEPDESTWIDAVNAGDLACLLTLMADDVVFLIRAKRRSAGMGSPPASRPPTNKLASVASTS